MTLSSLTTVDAVRTLIAYVGENPDREGLKDTPRRVLSALAEMTSGYSEKPAEILGTVFHEESDEMVVLRGVPFTSLCEHHMLPFSGTVDLGYIPAAVEQTFEWGANSETPFPPRREVVREKTVCRIVGISKLARLVECFARRLQVQERMTRQIADALWQHLKPVGVGVIATAEHSCMACRGVRKAGCEMVTSAMLGAMRSGGQARGEFLVLSARSTRDS